jgi:hypothetical protein
MPEEEDIAARQTRELLRLLHDGLGQPPLHWQMRTALIGVLNMLAEQDMGIRWAARERVGELLGERDQPPEH